MGHGGGETAVGEALLLHSFLYAFESTPSAGRFHLKAAIALQSL